MSISFVADASTEDGSSGGSKESPPSVCIPCQNRGVDSTLVEEGGLLVCKTTRCGHSRKKGDDPGSADVAGRGHGHFPAE